MSKTALITGITGQDGAYLSQFLLGKGYRVIGLVRSYLNPRIEGLKYLGIDQEVKLEYCDLQDHSQIINLIARLEPDEIYNLAAQSSVSTSFAQPIGTIHFNIISVLYLLEAIKLVNPGIRFYQASSSEMYGRPAALPIVEDSVFHPLSPYGISKASAHWIAINYREVHNLFTCCGILFNHESFLRSENFFVKKVLRQSIEIKYGLRQVLEVGNIEIKRDFGYAREYVKAMWLMLQQEKPDDYIICSGRSISLRQIIEHVFERLGIPIDKLVVKKELFRPTEILDNYGDNSKARRLLDWDYDMSFFDVLDILLEEELAHFHRSQAGDTHPVHDDKIDPAR
ncbi:MAG: GDP-mannose 4,6-dehydratase [Saprospiraceae bacterium]|nr:MAG: GDP-mannose 4,6-dehydratase [Saprospiraceae bacterium]